MESSVLLCKGCTPWQRLLLTAFLLTFWLLSTTAHETTVSVPPIVSEGDDVLFLVHNLPGEIESLAWFKGLGDEAEEIATYALHRGLSRPGPAHNSRETIYHNGSMLFEKVNLKDTEFYTLRTYNRSGKIISTANVYLNVYGEVDSKNLLATQPVPAKKPTVWGPAYSGRETLHSDGSLLLHDVTEKDHGLYTLRILRTDMGIEEAQVQLHVDSSHSLFCDTLTSSQLMIQAEPRYVSEGEDVLLQVHNLPEDVQAFSWHKSKDGSPIFKLNRAMPSISWDVAQRTKGMAFQNGSLLLQDITEKDAGIYTLEVLNKDFKIEKAYVKFYVKTLWHLSITASVTIESVPPLMAEGDNILFLVDNLPEKTVTLVWFKGLTNMKAVIAIYGRHINLSASGPLHSGRETIYYNGSLLIKNVTQKDTGFYTLRSYDKYLNIISTTYTYVHVHDFLWNCGRHVTSAQPTIESVPPIAAEGGSVRLLIHHLPENLQGFAWFKGMSVFRDHEIARITTDMNSSVMGPAHSGRETLNSDGSLLLHNITQNDAGLYTLRIMGTDLKSEEAHVQLHVNSSLSPCCNPLTSSQLMIQPVPLYASEGEDVLLQVHNLPEDLQAFTWYRAIYRVPYFEIVKCSRVLNTTTWGDQYSRRETVYPNGSLLLQDIAEKDAGMYTLEILKSNFKTEKAYVQFHVNSK
ncbi:hypothetical protein ACRRTK_000764 [Alexandromys fortis]